MDLSNLDVSMYDEDHTIKYCSLSNDFKYFRETVLYGKEVIILEKFKSILLKKELIEKQSTINDDLTQRGEGFVVRGKAKGNFFK